MLRFVLVHYPEFYDKWEDINMGGSKRSEIVENMKQLGWLLLRPRGGETILI